MKEKIILPIAFIILVGFAVLVFAWVAEYAAPISKGWNLVYGFISPDQLEGQSFDKSHIKAIYAFIPTTQQYLRAWPNPDEKAWQNLDSTMDDRELLQTAFWVYSDSNVEGSLNGLSGFTEYWLDDAPKAYNERPIYKGWNFVGVTRDMKGVLYKEFKGNCNLLKMCVYQRQNWDCGEEGALDSNEVLIDSDYDLGQGLVIKVSDNCRLGVSEGAVPSVPQLPDTAGTGCVDSDGGLTYITKGKVTDGSETLEDFCVNTIKLSEALCNNDGRGAYAQYDCSDGCYGGACIVPLCVLNAPFSCNHANVKANNIDIELRNVESESFNIKNVVINGCGSYSTTTSINANEVKTIKVPCSTALVPGNKFIGDISIDYKKMNGNFDLRSSGRIVDMVM